MNVFALADFHLSFDTPGKSMEVFGVTWKDWTEKISTHCHEMIKPSDLLLIAGDISWATTLDHALKDLQYIASLPGIKILLKGNHDYWWPSYAKLLKALPPSLFAIQNNSLDFGNISIGGTRLWDTTEYNFSSLIDIEDHSFGKDEIHKPSEGDEKIYKRELLRLEMSLESFGKNQKKIVMTHYPPIGADLHESSASKLFDRFTVDVAVFGHLHSLKKNLTLFGKKNKTSYFLTSCDYLDFKPIQIEI